MIHKIKCLVVVLTCASYVENIKMVNIILIIDIEGNPKVSFTEVVDRCT